MQPYVVKQGDYLAALAHRFGFDADTVWNDDKNADLRKLRPDPNILWPTDVLYIPDQVDAEPATHQLETGTTNTFLSDAPTVPIEIRVKDPAFASQDYTVPELPQLAGLTTTADGTATFAVPVTLPACTMRFTASGKTFTFNVGHLDPINQLSGVFQRLQSLGHIHPDAQLPDPPDMDMIRAALRALRAAQSSSSTGSGAPDASASPPDAAPSGDTDVSAASSDVSATPSSGAPSGGDAWGDASDFDDAPYDAQNNAGLSDEGHLDDATTKLLSDAHGV
jgi:N-acetylmuramoyl-L-alanine amidase